MLEACSNNIIYIVKCNIFFSFIYWFNLITGALFTVIFNQNVSMLFFLLACFSLHLKVHLLKIGANACMAAF